MKKTFQLFSLIRKSHPFKNNRSDYARYIANDRIVNLDGNTLTGRLMLYLKSKETEFNPMTENFEADKLLNTFMLENTDEVKINNSKLISLIRSLEDENLVKSNREFYGILKKVDVECCFRQNTLNTKEILSFLDAYMGLVPHRITELKFYTKAIDHLFANVNELKANDYIKFLFYVALKKKNEKHQNILRETLSILKNNDLKELSTEELCIIANAAYKTSTKISNKNILEKIKCYLNDNLMLLRDPAIFVTFIKCLRHNRYCNEDLLSTISCALFFNKAFELYTFQTYCHLLALYSDNLYYDKKLLEFVTYRCMEELRSYSLENSSYKKMRTKDFVRFLWGMSNLNITFLKDEDFEVIDSRLLEMIGSSDLDLNIAIDIFWYLWMLNHKCYELVSYLLERRDLLNKIPEKSSTRQRLNQLIVCIYHEDRPLFNQLNLKPHGKTKFAQTQHLRDRPCLENIFRTLNTIGKKRKFRFEITYQIPHMNILGIIGYEKNIYKRVNVEVLDHFTTLKNSDSMPSGLMQTKLRILDGSEEALIVIKENEIDDFTEAQLQTFLEDELDLVC